MEISTSVNAHSTSAAIDLFLQTIKKLLDTNQWAHLSDAAASPFQLTDGLGILLPGPAAPGNFIRIDIPGQGREEGQEYDWVRIEKTEHLSLSDNYELFILQVRPAMNPSHRISGHSDPFMDDPAIGFQEDLSISSFVIERDGQYVNTTVYGLKEPKGHSGIGPAYKIRNQKTGITGLPGLSKIQWQALVNGLLRNEIK